MSLQAGQQLQNRYRIIKSLGQGGMGAVYLAQDSRLGGKAVAIKELNPGILKPQDRQWAVSAFDQEARILAQLNHPALTAVTDYFSESGLLYLVMEYVLGETLEQLWQKQPGRRFNSQIVLNWAGQLCSVLEYLHSQARPVIFRDLKPANIIVQSDGRLKLIDFGIARYFKPGRTRDTMALGTPGYAAPEQYGQSQADPRSDIYALGVILHQLLTGQDPTLHPFHFLPVAQLAPNVPSNLATAVTKAVQQVPQQRPQNIQEFDLLLNPAIIPNIPYIVTIGLLILFLLVIGVFVLPDGRPLRLAAVPDTPVATAGTIVNVTIITVTIPVIDETLTITLVVTEPAGTPTIVPTTTPTATPIATITPAPAAPELRERDIGPAAPSGRLAFVSNRAGRDAVYIMDVGDPANARQVTNPSGRDWWPAWCGPDTLLFERADDVLQPTWQEIYRVSVLNPAQIEQVTSNQMPSGSDQNGFPSCSPDGRYLSFSAHFATSSDPRDFNIGLVDTLLSSWRFNIFGNGYSLGGAISWSPDGRAITFMHLVSRNFQVYRTNLSDPYSYVNLTEDYDGNSKYPDWSPDGAEIAFACGRSPAATQIWGLCSTLADRSAVTLLLSNLHEGAERDSASNEVFHAVTPSWSPDGRWLAFASSQGGNWDIYLYDVTEGKLTNLTRDWPSKEMHPRWAPE
jgi:serine/threonine protein kinase